MMMVHMVLILYHVMILIVMAVTVVMAMTVLEIVAELLLKMLVENVKVMALRVRIVLVCLMVEM